MKRLCIITLGCPKNIVEGETIAGDLSRAGWSLTTDLARAEAALVHTCAFVADARRESRSVLKRLCALKAAGRIGAVYASGCLVQSSPDLLARDFPQINGMAGTGALARLPGLLSEGKGMVCGAPGGLLDGSRRLLSSRLPSAYLRLSEGCSHRCSFCDIPRIRGPQKSRPAGSILSEARVLSARGVREIVLVAQDTTAYGRDRGRGETLSGIIDGIKRIDGVRWLRIMYAHPARVDAGILSRLREGGVLCRYLDMPIQHVSESMLLLMRRPRGVRGRVERIARAVPGISLRTSVIVGFPGESARDFRELRDFVAQGWFDHLGVFEFSAVPEVAAAHFPGQVPRREARDRRLELLDAQARSRRLSGARHIGAEHETLVERSTGSQCRGRAWFQAPEVDGSVRFSCVAPAGSFVRVRMTGRRYNDFTGKQVVP